MAATLSELADHAGADFSGDADAQIRAVNTLEHAEEGDVAFLSNIKYKDQLLQTEATAVILEPALAKIIPQKNLILSENPYLAYALIAQKLNPVTNPSAGIHASAIVHESSVIDSSASIAELVSIGENCRIGKNVSIGAGAVIGENCHIGDDSVIAPNVTLAKSIVVGERCFIQSGAVIGGDGFGFANDQGHWIKIPQTGTVIIGNDVEIGANTTVDRGAIRDTIIENGVKLDNLIQVGHNVRIGKHTAIAASAAIAGSTVIGQYCTIGGCSGLTGHLHLADHVHISGMTKVTASIEQPGHYTGNISALSHKHWSRSMARFKQLDDMAKKIKKLEKIISEKM